MSVCACLHVHVCMCACVHMSVSMLVFIFVFMFADVVLARFTAAITKMVNYPCYAVHNVYGHTKLKAPVLVRSLKLTNFGLR